MIDIPKWLKESIHKYACLHCACKMKESDILGIGVRMSSKYKNKSVFFFEYLCKECKNRVFVELDFMTVEDLVMQMLDDYTNTDDVDVEVESKKSETFKEKQKKELKNPKRKSGISKKDLKDAVKVLKDIETWDDFLKQLGFSDDEIVKNKEEGSLERENKIRENNV